MTVRPAAPPLQSQGYLSVTAAKSATFQPRRSLTLVRLRVRDDILKLPAPTPAQWAADIGGARDRYPVAEDQFIAAIAPGWDEFGTGDDIDLPTEEGWEDLVDEVDDIADEFDAPGQIWVAVTPNDSRYNPVNGAAHAAYDFPWPLSDDHRVMTVRTGLPATYAHEMGHTLGLDHAPCGGPDDIDPRLPGGTEAGTLGRRASDGALFTPGWSELMSYCPPPSGMFQDRWPSVACWDILFDTIG